MAQFDPITGMRKQRRGNNPFDSNFVPDAAPTNLIGGAGRFELDDLPLPGPVSIPLPTVPPGSQPGGTPGFSGGSSVPNPQAPPGFSAGNLLSQILGDPLYIQQKAQLAAEGVSDRSGLTAARQRALTMFGDVPDFGASAGMLGEGFFADVNDTTRGLAAQNTQAGLSTTARIKQAHQDSLAGIKNALAARGILSSGETGYQYGRADLGNRQAQSDATQQLLDYLAGAQSAFVQAQRQRQQSEQNALFAAAGRIPPQYPPYAWPPYPSYPPPPTVTPPGEPPPGGQPPGVTPPVVQPPGDPAEFKVANPASPPPALGAKPNMWEWLYNAQYGSGGRPSQAL